MVSFPTYKKVLFPHQMRLGGINRTLASQSLMRRLHHLVLAISAAVY
jgi:hypothetical protein